MIVSVLPLRPVSKTYSYAVPNGCSVVPGQIVRIPFGKKKGDATPTLGVVWDVNGDPNVPKDKLKTLEPLGDLLPLSDHLRQFLEWAAQYTLSPLGAFARMALPLSDVTRPTPKQTRYRLVKNASQPKNMSEARKKLLDLLGHGSALTRSEIKNVIHISDSVITALVQSGLIESTEVEADETWQDHVDADTIILPDYNDAQKEAADRLVQHVTAQDFSVTLLDGVTGSGKTEVYFAAIKEALRIGKQVLVLVPEIALTSQLVERFTKRFGVAPVTWHSHLTTAQRRRHFKAVAHGQTQVVLGARSALFLPHQNLGLVIIDEEHDSSYKQEEGVFYNARDLAIKRAHLEKHSVVLVSATPSLETFHNAQTGKYEWLRLQGRYAEAQMPDTHVIDMRAEKIPRTQFLSPTLLTHMRETLDKKEQVMLYLNRRGYAPLTLCRTCGHRVECPRCSAWMVQHRAHHHSAGGLICHHCGWHMPQPKQCASCKNEDSLVAIGPGVERIEDEVKAHFPDARVIVLSSDTHKSMSSLSEALHQIQDKKVDIIIGTQIVAKGHHFPMLTLVGVVDADLGLGGGDLRAGERTFQTLHQVSGRAGRGERPGAVYLQSFMPDHPVIQTLAAGDRDRFLEAEAQERHMAHMPPAGRLVSLIISSKNESLARRCAADLAACAPPAESIRVLGPAPAAMAKIRHQYRFRLLVKGEKDQNMQKYTRLWLEACKIPAGVRIQVDVDPYSFM